MQEVHYYSTIIMFVYILGKFPYISGYINEVQLLLQLRLLKNVAMYVVKVEECQDSHANNV